MLPAYNLASLSFQDEIRTLLGLTAVTPINDKGDRRVGRCRQPHTEVLITGDLLLCTNPQSVKSIQG